MMKFKHWAPWIEEEHHRLRARVSDLEARLSSVKPPTTNATASASFVPSTGRVGKPSRSGTVSQAEIGVPTVWAIMEGSKSTRSTLPELVEFSEDSSTLTLTLRWLTTSGETPADGVPGHQSVGPDEVTR